MTCIPDYDAEDEQWLAAHWPVINDGSCCYNPASMEFGPNYPCPLDVARLARLEAEAKEQRHDVAC